MPPELQSKRPSGGAHLSVHVATYRKHTSQGLSSNYTASAVSHKENVKARQVEHRHPLSPSFSLRKKDFFFYSIEISSCSIPVVLQHSQSHNGLEAWCLFPGTDGGGSERGRGKDLQTVHLVFILFVFSPLKNPVY